jgi:hypothetical protein
VLDVTRVVDGVGVVPSSATRISMVVSKPPTVTVQTQLESEGYPIQRADSCVQSIDLGSTHKSNGEGGSLGIGS